MLSRKNQIFRYLSIFQNIHLSIGRIGTCSLAKKITVQRTVVVAAGLVEAILGVEADILTVDSALNLEDELILSKAARTSCFILTNNFPLRHGFCKFRGRKSSLKQRSLLPITATKQKFFNLSFSYTGPSRPLRMTAMFNCLITKSMTSRAVVSFVTVNLTEVPEAKPVS